MMHFPKTQRPDLQDLLDQEARKTSGSYRLEPVLTQMTRDFLGKCYLCEDAEPTGIQMDHFQPHQGDTALKFSWDNLFFSCSHCNGTKGDNYFPLLDCTQDDRVWEQVEITVQRFPKVKLEVKAHSLPGREQACENTVQLLRRCFEGRTPIRKLEAENLRKKMLRHDVDLADAVWDDDEPRILAMIQVQAGFAGMHRWTLCREYPEIWERLRRFV